MENLIEDEWAIEGTLEGWAKGAEQVECKDLVPQEEEEPNAEEESDSESKNENEGDYCLHRNAMN